MNAVPLPQIPEITPANGTDWRAALAKRGSRIIGDERNVLLALRVAPDLRGLVRYDEFALRVEFSRRPPWRAAPEGAAWTDEDDLALQAWLQEREIEVRHRGIVADSVALVARDAAVHPVRHYLQSLTWDGEPRLAQWLVRYLDAQADPFYLQAVGRKFLVSAVARIEQPGCQCDHVLVLEGPQGIGKSQAAKAIAIRPEWFTDGLPDIHSKDAALQLCGRWIIELAELAALRRSDVEAMKAFVTRQADVFRPPYGRRAVTVPRQSVFVATTNEAHYLRDTTGNRRFWPVRCARIDLDALRRDAGQLWAEAAVMFREGAMWHLTDSEGALARQEQNDRVLVSELEAAVSDYLARMESQDVRELSAKQVMHEALHLDVTTPDFAERAGRLGAQVAAAMQSCGWTKVRTIGRSPNRRTIYRKTAEAL